MREKGRPLLIIGLDGGDPEFIRQWVAEGRLPTLARLMEGGCHGTTGGPELLSEHGVWVSTVTGVSRGQTGFFYFRQLEPGTYQLRPFSGLDVEVEPFWNRLRGGERRVVVVDVPDVFPVRGVPGVQLANWAPHLGWSTRDPAYRPAGEPRSALRMARQAAGRRSVVREKTPSTVKEDLRIFRQLRRQVAAKGRLCHRLLARERPDLAMVVFCESHTAAHQFWDYRPEANHWKGEAAPQLQEAIAAIYADIDREVATLLEMLPEANVALLTSVGITDHHPTVGLAEAFCRQLGYEVPAKGPPFSLSPLTLARRCVPEPLRVAASRRLPRDTRERLLADSFRAGTDWKRTVAFAVPSLYSSSLRVNLRGREPQGIVAPGEQYDQLLDRLTNDLLALEDPAARAPAVRQVCRTRDLFGPEAHPALPDLFVHWVPRPYFLERIIHPTVELVQPPLEFNRTSDHTHTGFVCFSGPDIEARGSLAEVEVLDLAPTFLRLLGLPAADDLRGRPVPVLGSAAAGGR